METLRVELGSRSYPIHIGKGLLASPELILPHLRRRAMVVSNETVAPLWLDRLRAMVAGIELDSVILPDGERYKTLETMNLVYTALLEGRHDRGTTLIALGGGVVGDMTGFAAATYQRGVDFIQVPTTLLAQVDSSVGGKTGVNHPLGKNMIGAFHQPQCVVVDTGTLSTLPDRELSAGLAEVIKYGIIADAEFFSWLEENIDALLARDDSALVHAIRRSCEIKARIVAEDEREAGVRALLNLGHTFGHAIEAGMGYGEWLHGEAVAAGMVMAARMAARLGWLAAGEVDRIVALTARARLPVAPPPEVGVDLFLELMAVDKKAQGGRVRLVLPRGIGAAVVAADYPDGALVAVLDGRSTA